MQIEATGLTDVGRQREHNEDSYCVLSKALMVLVADGMGGHKAGNIASAMASHTLADFFDHEYEKSDWPFQYNDQLSIEENRLVFGIRLANKRIFEASRRYREVDGMGTTVVCLTVSLDRGAAYIAHVGDSRAYRIRNKQIRQLTKDHSLVNEYIDSVPNLTQEQIDLLPKNVITRALGISDAVVIDLTIDPVQHKDIYLLCSDGLSGMLTDEQMVRIVNESKNLTEAKQKLIDAANENGGEDNITVVLLQINNENPFTKEESTAPGTRNTRTSQLVPASEAEDLDTLEQDVTLSGRPAPRISEAPGDPSEKAKSKKSAGKKKSGKKSAKKK